ncbi:hypothetical protein AUR64_17970 [Haloprofundus marisrubri]|uniref:Right handed beta helix domain-containing protein n=1 Tax=Haloprofundus marisrubri TaxID=1514971 RepID=A0A0W1R5A5_9EURY|nr:right-handed parallel beta-helix repeat-containing protein [Haloprofundus marisrubri]KTG08563.1 hypothetical protein AUR64_17970 [Haloprofundus marisrubri]
MAITSTPLVVAFVVLVVLATFGAVGEPTVSVAASFGVRSPGGPTVLDDCAVLTEPGVYVLGNDIETTQYTCLELRSSDIVLDGGGHTVGPSAHSLAYGKHLAMPTPAQFGVGVAVGSSEQLTNVTVTNIRLTGLDVGTRLQNVDGATISDVNAVGNARGIVVVAAHDVAVRQSSVTGSETDGIVVRASSNVSVAETTANENAFAGVVVADSTDVTVSETTVHSNGGDGVFVRDATGVVVRDLAAVDNAVGVLLFDSPGTLVTESYVDRSAFAGVGVVHSDSVVVTDTTIRNTTATLALLDDPAAIWLVGSNETTLREVVVSGNENWSLYARDGSENVTAERFGTEDVQFSFVATDVAVDIHEESREGSESSTNGEESDGDGTETRDDDQTVDPESCDVPSDTGEPTVSSALSVGFVGDASAFQLTESRCETGGEAVGDEVSGG